MRPEPRAVCVPTRFATRPRRLCKPNKGRLDGRLTILFLCAAAIALLSGCGLLRAPQKVVTAVIPGDHTKGADPVDLQLQLERFADEFSAQTSIAIDEYVARSGTDSARLNGLKWKLQLCTAAVSITSGPHPAANLLDLVALTSLGRMAAEERVAQSTNAQAAEPFLQSMRVLETNVWILAGTALEPAQVNELRDAIVGWHTQHPEARAAFFARPQEFAALVKTSLPKGNEINSVFSLISLDPTAGLDPAVREVTLTRLFAERAMYTAQRMPFLLRLQAELLTAQVAQQPDIQLVLTNTARVSESVDRLSRAAETISQTAAQLPDRLSTERKEILAALDHQEGKLRGMAAEVNQSLVSADKMSASLSITITNFDALMKRFGVGEPTTSSASDTNSPPFNILDYAATAGKVGDMAKEITALITSVNQSMPQVTQLGQQATADAGRLIDRAFWRALVLIVVLLVGSVLAALTYRRTASKFDARKQPAPAVESSEP